MTQISRAFHFVALESYRNRLKLEIAPFDMVNEHNQVYYRKFFFSRTVEFVLVAFWYLNNRVFLSRNYRLIVAPLKFDVCPRSETRTSNFQGATIRPIVPRHKHSIVFIVHH